LDARASPKATDTGPLLVPVDQQQPHAGRHEQAEEGVEHGDAADGERQPVQAQQERGQRRDAATAEQPQSQQVSGEDRQGTRHRGGEAPAEAVVAEHGDPAGHQPLADGRVDHEVGLHALLQQLPGVLGVVELVEVGPLRVAQVPEPQYGRDQEHDHRQHETRAAVAARVRGPPVGRRRGPCPWRAGVDGHQRQV
jgi:hypothetical protein